MDREAVLAVIRPLLAEEFEVEEEEITFETDFYEDLWADSLDMEEFSYMVQEEFALKKNTRAKDAAYITTVGEAVDFILDHLA